MGALVASTVLCFAFGLTVLGLSYKWFHPAGAGECSLNVFLVTITLLLGLGYSAAVVHPSVRHGSLLCSGVIFAYNSYLLFSALSSEPEGYVCKGEPFGSGAAAGQVGSATGIAVALVSVAYSAVRAGSSGVFLNAKEEEEENDPHVPLLPATPAVEDVPPPQGSTAPSPLNMEAGSTSDEEEGEGEGGKKATHKAQPQPVKYSASFFHLTYALASCYTAMLLTNWGSEQGTDGKGTIGVGWASTWVKVASTFVTAGLYTWSLVGPMLFPDRDFS